MSEDQEPTEKQKAAAYDRFVNQVGREPEPGHSWYFASLLRRYAMEAPTGDKQMEDWKARRPK